jgi:Protein of unknown function (DUF3307)
MTDPAKLALLGVLILLVKHLVFDYFLQTSYMVQKKGIYGHPGGILHSGLHAVGTMPVFIWIPPSASLGLAIIVGEFIVHYHLDWAKEQVVRRMQWMPKDPPFWWALGVDQFLHGLTYIAIVALLLRVL